ncbi:VOC family protein [Candidatus Enterovibrio escicola]|uniref:Lactoylglutathione lyase n=1 Tax=Candidatus Enterovibrio escicola TaxID=1927127 RepID=A0A2A5T3H5_9GAMM|nr:VOC family protein [Candidatus Enterovibrio escacola]PCS22723.1 Lactoylglutathione lyase [Candidatus Enterovibrio escacola]
MNIAGIDHIVLRTVKLDLMLTFYCDVLGCQVERTLSELGLTQLRAGNALIDLVEVDSLLSLQCGTVPTNTGNNLGHFCLQLKPITNDELSAELFMHGIDSGEFFKRYGAQGMCDSIYIEDPECNIVELKSQPIG